ncbi:manganese catalase family protein [Anaerosacchariphilus polymeriproducens]
MYPLCTKELAHLEIVGTMVRQLLKNATPEQIMEAGAAGYYTDHDNGVYPASASGTPFTAAALQVKGDPIVDLTENLAAEQKARGTYEHLLNMTDDPDIIEPLKFLREREVVHFQRFGEALRIVQDYLQEPHLYVMPKPEFMNQ